MPDLSNSPLGGDKLTAQFLSSPKCPEDILADLMILLQNPPSTCNQGVLVPCTLRGTLLFEHGVYN